MIREFINTFRTPSAKSLAQGEYEEAQRKLLAAKSATEYANSMVTYHQARVTRLAAYLRSEACQ